MKKRLNIKRIKRFTSAVIACVMLLTFGPFADAFKWTIDLTVPLRAHAGGTETINSYSDLVKYTKDGRYDPDDTLNISITTGAKSAKTYQYFDDPANEEPTYIFEGIGTSTQPFRGSVIIEATNYKTFNLNTALFDYISTDATIILNVNGSDSQDHLILTAFETMTNKPLFANHVVKGNTNNAEWKIELQDYNDGTAHAYTYGGLIGNIEKGCNVKLDVTNNRTAVGNDQKDISVNGNAGLICGSLGTAGSDTNGATLQVKLGSGDNTNHSITSTSASGNAGGLVGEMGSGSKLLLDGTSAGWSGITQSITAGGYAGGIVGKADNAYIGTDAVPGSVDTAVMTISDSFKTTSTTVNGASGSGYLFGYYKTGSARTFNITWSQNGVSANPAITLDSSQSGGLFGVLENTSTTGAAITINGGQTVNATTASTLSSASATTMNVKVSNSQNVYNKGGLIGNYSSQSLKNTLDISNCIVKISDVGAVDSGGGIIGRISQESGYPDAYVKLSNIYTKTSAGNSVSNGGGLIGGAGEATNIGAFIDVSGYIKIDGRYSAGLVKKLQKGVLRIEGITDLSGLTSGNMIVGTRDIALIYSRGSGSDTITTGTEQWRLIRPNDKHKNNDVGTWGEVLRLTKTGLTGNAIIDETNTDNSSSVDYHTVTLKPAPSGTISTFADFVLLALNIQLNTTNTSGVLKVSGSKSTALLSSTITLADGVTFDLSDTGITGLTRDCNGTSYESGIFSGTIQGGTSAGNLTTIKLAIGEAYGVDSSDNAVSDGTEGSGKIYSHVYNGLIARSKGATFKDFAVTGTQYIGINGDYLNFGAVSALSYGGANASEIDTFDGIDSDVTVYMTRASNHRAFVGGVVGQVASDARGKVAFTSCTSAAIFSDGTQNTDTQPESYFGGYIGLVNADADNSKNKALSIDFGTYTSGTSGAACAVGGSYSNTIATTAQLNTIYGGLIGGVRGNNSHAIDKRTINVNKVTVDGLTINSKSNTASGGLLGYAWHDADVNLQDVSVGTATTNTVEISGGTGTALTGLVYNATGHWAVDTVNIQKVSFVTSVSSSSLGLLVNDGINNCILMYDNAYDDRAQKYTGKSSDKTASLYLELKAGGRYTINGNNSNVDVDSKVAVFDELVAFTKHPDRDIAENGHAIVSIGTKYTVTNQNNESETHTALYMDGTHCNTYQNQSYYGKNTVTVNPNTRYYYNLDTIRVKGSNASSAEKMLLWSVTQYAWGDAVKKYFDGTTSGVAVSSISGSLDMTGLSYYPVDYSGGLTLAITNLTFRNSEIETGESASGNTDGFVRSTTSTTNPSQHYMMHCGLFRNVSAGINLGGNMTIQGNVGILPSGSGFLVCDTFGGGANVIALTNGSHTLTLNGAYVNGVTLSTDNAPILVSKVRSNTTIELNGVKSQGYTSKTNALSDTNPWFAATSLIGEVGNEDGTLSSNMNVKFSEIVLDGRTEDVSDPTENAAMNTAYGSTRTIFSKAILLGHFVYEASNCSGTYNFTYNEDWGTTKHQVTYGKEISDTKDYVNEQSNMKYLNDSTHYVSPTSASASSAASFSNFRPYVGKFDTMENDTHVYKYRELKVNHSTENLESGCGMYNDPYLLTADNLNDLAEIINGDSTNYGGFGVRLPLSIADQKASGAENYTPVTSIVNLGWCTTDSDAVFTYDDGYYRYTAANGDAYQIAPDKVRQYLAGAYYMIQENIELTNFKGLGGANANYAFRGVVVGKEIGDGVYPKVTLTTTGGTSSAPFINISNGCVVKDLQFEMPSTVTVNLSQTSVVANLDYSGGGNYFGVVIGKIMGGDNVIDRVDVSFNGTINASDATAYIVPAGAYVGVVVNGGLFFRNMENVAHKAGFSDSNFNVTNTITLLDGTTLSAMYPHHTDNTKYLYINPIIGRVINGYAMTETASTYTPSESNATIMKNGTKNYAIANISEAEELLNVHEAISAQGSNPAKNASIEVPNAQAWFIMSCIVNSGTGNGSSSYQMGNLASDASSPNISYSAKTFKTTHIGKYDDVGCGTTSSANKQKKLVNGSYAPIDEPVLFNSNNMEIGNDAKVTPYIVYKYTRTEGQTDFYKKYAKSLTGKARAIIMNPAYSDEDDTDNYHIQDTWTLPDGYRGIGGLNSDNKDYNISVNGMTCNNTIINLNMKYQTYLYSTTNKIYQENYYPSDVGFGLFNTFKPSVPLSVSDLTLKGNVYVETLDYATGEPKYIYGTKNSYNAYDKSAQEFYGTTNGRVSAGMFAGIKSNTNALILNNVTIHTVDVHSSRAAGGLLGIAQYVTLTECPAINVSVEGKWDTGGYIGGASNTITITGASAAKTEFNINTIVMTGIGYNERINGRPGAVGGLVGRQYGGTVNISNMKLSKYGTYGIVKNYQNQDNISSDETPVGGIVGSTHLNLTVSNCEVNNITVYGDYSNAGGVLGSAHHNSQNTTYNISINNVSLDGTNSTYGLYITNRLGLGGFIGKVNLNKPYNVTISDSSITNYHLTKSANNSSGDNYIGGIIGVQAGDSSSDTILKNVLISDCVFSLPATGNYAGMVGSLRKTLTGYNIAIKNITLADGTTTAWYKGDVFVAANTKPTVKIVGFSRQNTLDRDDDGTADDLITATLYSGSASSSSYIIFSDFSGTGFDGTVNTDKPLLGSSTAEAMVDTAKPYATVNPAREIVASNLLLTGDGIAVDKDNLPINAIAADNTNKKYAIVSSTAINKFKRATTGNYLGKLSTFNTETGATLTNDFAVLIVDDLDRGNTTDMIESYIQALTNTTDNYATSTASSKFNVAIYKMTLNNGSFTKTTPANLKHSGNQFYMDGKNVDTSSDAKMFSLIDVQFYDPTTYDASETTHTIAYHLYIPVFVKKQLNYTFRIASGSGSNYEQSWYNNRFGKIGIENYGSPVTLYFDYEYERTEDEWEAAITAGDNLLDNFNKQLFFSKSGAELPKDTANNHAKDTVLVLIDRNDNNRPYYAYASDVLSGNESSKTLSLRSFTTELGGSTHFKEQSLQDLLKAQSTYYMKAVRDDTSGIYKKLESSTEATIKAKLNGTDDYFALIDGTESPAITEKYSISITSDANSPETLSCIKESYYITIFTPEMASSPSIYHETISHVNLGNDPTPTKIKVNDSVADVQVVLGNVFTQTTTISQSLDTDPVIVPTTNETVTAHMETEISITDNTYRSFFDASVSVYHSFLTYMTKHENGTSKGLFGNPQLSGTFSILDENNSAISNGNYSSSPSSTTDSGNYAEFAEGVDLREYLISEGDVVTIKADVNLCYNGEAKIAAQFPPRTSPEQDTHLYTVISGASNIAYDSAKTAYSKTRKDATEQGSLVHYYTKTTKAARLEYNAYADENGVYGQLGINARADEKELTNGKAEIKTVAVYDVSDIIQSVPKSQYDRVRCTFELQQKQQNGSYGSPLTISDYLNRVYLDGLTIEDAEHTLVANTADYILIDSSTKYTFDIVRNKLVQSGDTAEAVMSIPITFDVYSGAGCFEENGSMYSNYKVYITVELYNSSAPETSVYTLKKHIVYTNAKLISDFIG